MNSTFTKKLFSLAALCSLATAQANDCIPSPTFVPRSQGSNTVLKLVGMTDQIHMCGNECPWGTFAITPFYSQTFRGRDIARCLFGPDLLCNVNDCTVNNFSCCDDSDRSILIQGSQVANRNPNAWLADYFYLPTDFQSQVSFSPRIRNFLLNFDLYIGLDSWVCGMYFRAYGPFNWTKWELNLCESVCASGTNSHTPGYFAPTGLQRSQLLTDFATYASGQAPAATAPFTTSTGAELPSVQFGGLRYARMDNCEETRTGFADLWLELGWDFLCCEDYHVSAAILAGVPTGNRRRACRVFDPVIGNGNHWQLGGAFSAHYDLWTGCDGDKQLSIWVDANITHLFAANEERTFDLCRRPNSRYMLAERLRTPVIFLGSRTTLGNTAENTPSAQFGSEFTPVANLTTFNTRVKVGVQGDVSAMLNYTWCNFSLDLGYNFWARSCESISCDPCSLACNTTNLCDPRQDRSWALKGDARVFGFALISDGGVGINDPVALSATQSLADIHSGRNAVTNLADFTTGPVSLATDAVNQNAGVDNPQFATGESSALLFIAPSQGGVAANQILTSFQPIFLSCDDIDFRETRGLSHKVFAHLSYLWECGCWSPYLGVGGSAEFGHKNHDNCASSCNNCIRIESNACPSCTDCALSQWAVWLKGGISFN